MAEDDREEIAKLIARLEAQQAAIQALLEHIKKTVAPLPQRPADPRARRKSPRRKKRSR
jgi:hypothetical protein